MENQSLEGREADIWNPVEEKLRQKLSKEDTFQMAQNLGSFIIENCGALSPQKKIRQTFAKAFDGEVVESKIKNRKRLILLPDEVKNRSMLDFHLECIGENFKQLAKALGSTRIESLELLTKNTSLQPPSLKRHQTDNFEAIDLINDLCRVIDEKYALVDYFKVLTERNISISRVEQKNTDASIIIERPNFSVVIDEPQDKDGRLPKVSNKNQAYSYYFKGDKVFDDIISMKSKGEDICYYRIHDYLTPLVTALAPTIYLGELHLPKPILKVTLPENAASKNNLLSKDCDVPEFFRKNIKNLPFINSWYGEFSEDNREEYAYWSELILNQDGEYIAEFALNYSAHYLFLMLLPNNDFTEISPHFLMTGDHCDNPQQTNFLSDNFTGEFGEPPCGFFDDGTVCFYYPDEVPLCVNSFSLFSPLASSVFDLNSWWGKHLITQICDDSDEQAWGKVVDYDEIYDDYNPVFFPDFDETLEQNPKCNTNTILGKLQNHLLSLAPQDNIFNLLDKDAKTLQGGLVQFLATNNREIVQKKAKIINHLKNST